MRNLSRDRFAAGAFVLAALAASSFVESQVTRLKTPVAAQAGRFSITLRGTAAVPIADFSGGGAQGEVLVIRQGTSPMPKKSIGNVSYAPIEIEMPLTGRNPMTIWVEEMIKGSGPRRDGAIATVGAAGLDFVGALIEEVKIPDLDGAISTPGRLSLKIMANQTRRTAAAARVEPSLSRVAKNWLTSNFKVSIPGIDASRVRKIESFSIKQEAVRHTVATGTDRFARFVPGRWKSRTWFSTYPKRMRRGFSTGTRTSSCAATAATPKKSRRRSICSLPPERPS